MSETLQFTFQVGGVRDVSQAFRSVEQSIVRMERLLADSANRERATNRSRAKDHEATEKKNTKVTDAEAKARLKAEVAAAKASAAEKKKAEKDALDAKRKADREMLAETKRTLREEGAEKRRRAREDADLYRFEARQRRALMKDVAREEAEASRRRAASDKAAADRRKQFAGTVSGSVGKVVGGAASLAGAALTIGGGFTIADSVQKSLESERASIALANSMYNPNDEDQKAFLKSKGQKRFDAKQLQSMASAVGVETNTDASVIQAGWQDYIAKSSDWKALSTDEGQKTMLELARLAKATGTDFGEVMSAAGSMRVQNANLDPKQMMELMYGVVGQGKMGAVEMKDLAKYASVVTSGSSKFGMKQADAQRALLGLTQVAVRTSSSPADASTAVARFSGDVAKKAAENEKSLAKQGFKVTDKTGQLLKPSEILQEYFRVTGGNTTKMGEGKGNLGLGGESIKVAQGLAPVFQQAVEDAKAGTVSSDTRKRLGLGDKKTFDEKELNRIGADAVRAEVAKFETAGYEKKEIDEDLQKVMEGRAERLQKSMSRLSKVVEARAVPFLEKLAATLEAHQGDIERFLNIMADLAEKLAAHPLAGLGAIMAAVVAKDIAAAQIGNVIKNAIAGGGGGGGLGGGGGAAGGGAGIGMALGAGAAAGAATWAVYKPAVDAALSGQTSGQMEAGQLTRDVKRGSPQERAAALARYQSAEKETGFGGLMKLAGNVSRLGAETIYSGVTGEKNTALEGVKQYMSAREIVNQQELAAAVQAALIEGARGAASQVSKANPNDASRNVSMAQRGGAQ